MNTRALNTQHDAQVNARPVRVFPIAIGTFVVAGGVHKAEPQRIAAIHFSRALRRAVEHMYGLSLVHHHAATLEVVIIFHFLKGRGVGHIITTCNDSMYKPLVSTSVGSVTRVLINGRNSMIF